MSKKITVHLDPDTTKMVAQYAENEEISFSEAACKLVSTGFARLRALRKYAKKSGTKKPAAKRPAASKANGAAVQA